ncbi:MAG: hypothetical protein QG620_84 [Patescibacteria group bacterium]|nr:hypothetical protein [Patescibacteria group bacterium]
MLFYMHESLAIIILAAAGFLISLHIRRSKKTGEKLVCFIGGGKRSCNEVVESEYSRTLGIPNEIAGMVYYVLALLFALIFLLFDSLGLFFILTAKISSTGAFLASMYFVGIQAFVLRKFCEWCLATAVINTLIFGIVWMFL